MKITIDVPDILPANFERPSPELKAFLKELGDLCARLSRQYRRVDNHNLFTAFVRCGADRVLDTESGKIKRIQFGSEFAFAGEGVAEDEEDVLSENDYIEEGRVVMDDDAPGNWVIARLCIEGYEASSFGVGYETLRSRDFESQGEKSLRSQEIFANIIKHLEEIAHKVPVWPKT